jgi:hypothetical protein
VGEAVGEVHELQDFKPVENTTLYQRLGTVNI